MKKFTVFWILMLSIVFYRVVYPHSNQLNKYEKTTTHNTASTDNRKQLYGSSLYFQNKRCRFPKPPEKDKTVFEHAIVMVKATMRAFQQLFRST